MGWVKIDVADIQVQGVGAADQIIKAIEYFNQLELLPDVIVIIRGGGSKDDLSAFNDEFLVRSIASSRVPILVGVGHEIDETLADLAADVSASTPSNAAQIIVPEKTEFIKTNSLRVASIASTIILMIENIKINNRHALKNVLEKIEDKLILCNFHC